jgi:nicotinate-nucleotide adenylyltransferase
MSNKQRRIGILGGTFDPIHVGHISIAQQIAQKLQLDEVVLLPAGNPPHKTANTLAPASDRLAMTRLASSLMARLSVSGLEASKKGISFTIDTVKRIKAEMGSQHLYWFIIGADTVNELHTWKNIKQLLKEISFAVASRPGFDIDFGAVEAELGKPAARALRGSIINIKSCDVSSTLVRLMASERLPLKGMVRAQVDDYIKRNSLYQK